MRTVLIIATSHDKLGDTGKPTGCWADEIMCPYVMFSQQGFHVDVVSMKGGKIPIDQGSMAEASITPYVKSFMADEKMSAAIGNTQSIDAVASIGKYDAIFIPGGHGVCFDMAESVKLQALLTQAFEAGKSVSAVCHGPVALANVKLSDGSFMVAGKKVTGFSNTEEEAVGLTAAVPYSLEDQLKKNGGVYSKKDNWESYAVADGNLVTGQNPQSAEAVADMVIAMLG